MEDELKLYLPKYLSAESQKELFSGLQDYPNNLSQRFYTEALNGEKVLFQGDGVKDLIDIELPGVELRTVSGVILNNTCDIFEDNIRFFHSRITYAPMVELSRYLELIRTLHLTEEQISDHASSIRNQQITQVFYLPEIPGKLKESIVFFDRVLNITNSYIDRSDLVAGNRLFTLSDLGHYIFLFKISLHFTRIQERIDRRAGVWT